MIRAKRDSSLEQMGKPRPREEKSLDHSQTLSSEPQWRVCRSPVPSPALSKPCSPSFPWAPGHNSLPWIPLHQIQVRAYTLSQAAGPPAPGTLTHTSGLRHRVPRGHGRVSVGPLPPHHSKGQPHRPGVVDDVSSHLGLQEGALGQAPVLVSRDLLANQGKEISQPQTTPPGLLPTSRHVSSSPQDDHVEGGPGALGAGAQSSEH